METEPTRYTEVKPFVNRVENQMKIVKIVSEMSQSFRINFGIRKAGSRTISYCRQADAIHDNVVFAKYEDKNLIYINRDLGERLDDEKETSEFRDYVLGALEKRGVVSKPNGLELIEPDKFPINLKN